MTELSKRLNFTMVYHPVPRPVIWGTTPRDNGSWEDPNSFDGMYGTLVRTDIDILVNTYSLSGSRMITTDFLLPYLEYEVKLHFNKELVPESWDWTFYTRPLHIHTCLVLFAILITIVFITNVLFKIFPNLNSVELIVFCGWLLFTMVNAFYSGAQTMFLASPLNIGINKISDVLYADPTWQLVTVEGYILFLHNNEWKYMEQFNQHLQRIDEGYKYHVKTIKVCI
jgi:hypothetical protein